MAKVDASKFMGMGQSGLGKQVAVNSKKITLLKNIVKTHQSKLGEKIGSLSPFGGGIDESIQTITKSVTSISETLLKIQEQDKDEAADDAKADQTKKRDLREKLLEGGKNLGKSALKGTMKALEPVKGMFDKIKDWLIKLFLAKAVVELFKWFGDPANQKKVSSIFRFIKDWWPAILTGLLLFAGSMLGPGGIILAVGALVIGFIPKIINTVKSLLGFTKETTKEAKKGETEANKISGDPDMDPANAPEPGAQSTPGTQEFNKGGTVPGSGDKDTVPAMLTPGEFVMSKGAVQKWGVGTLEGMNAAAGGKNTGSPSSGYSEGGEVPSMNQETGDLARRIDPLITGQPEQPSGVSGALLGGLDALTGGLFDFDGGSGGGLLSRGMGFLGDQLGGMFGGGTQPEPDLDLKEAIADLQNRFNYSIYDKKVQIAPTGGGGLGGSIPGFENFVTTLSGVPFIGPKIAEASEGLVEGVEGMIQNQHRLLHNVTGVTVSGNQTTPVTPGTPPASTTTVAYADAQIASGGGGGGQTSSANPGASIPNFNPAAKVSSHKVKVLGIAR